MEKIKRILSFKINDEVYEKYTFVELKVDIDDFEDIENPEKKIKEFELNLEFDSETLIHTGLSTMYYIYANEDEEKSQDYILKREDISLIKKYFEENNIKYIID